jgi:hypothetical protein
MPTIRRTAPDTDAAWVRGEFRLVRCLRADGWSACAGANRTVDDPVACPPTFGRGVYVEEDQPFENWTTKEQWEAGMSANVVLMTRWTLMMSAPGVAEDITLLKSAYEAACDWPRNVAYAFTHAPKGRTAIWRVPLDGTKPEKIALVAKAESPSVSHDGRALVFNNAWDGLRLRVLDLVSGAVGDLGPGSNPLCSPVSDAIAFCDGEIGDKCVALIDRHGRRERLFCGPQVPDVNMGGPVEPVSWSPDGRFLAAVASAVAPCSNPDNDPTSPAERLHRALGYECHVRRAVFDLERREVMVRPGEWSAVAWQRRCRNTPEQAWI